ncbi:MAG: S41 family peptidase [Verrucomicrobia bacterium]|nr:S41 family peptidase [Verrucomicrobiota bacterium]
MRACRRFAALVLIGLASWAGAQPVTIPQPAGTAAAVTSPGVISQPGPGHSPAPAVRESVDKLGPGELQQILSEIKSRYVDPQALGNQELSEATLEGLLSRLGPGISLEASGAGPVPAPDRPFRSEILLGRFGYIRLGGTNPQTLSKLDATLKDFRTRSLNGVVLDLRTVPPGDDYGQASEIAARFVPPDTEAFRSIQAKTQEERAFKTAGEPLYTGPLTVLINHDVAGPGEALAVALKKYARALLIGERTGGRTVLYDRVPVGQNLALKIAVTEIKVPGMPDIFPNGVVPDLEVKLPAAQQNAILTATDNASSLPFVTEDERPRTNEAALVAGKNPDLDAYEEQQANKGKPLKLKDTPLQRGLDFLTTIAFYRNG